MSRVTLVVAFLTLFIAACGGDTKPSTSTAVCNEDSECPSGQACVAGTCETVAQPGDADSAGSPDGGIGEPDVVPPDIGPVDKDVPSADAPPTVSITSPVNESELAYHEPVAFVGAVSDDLDAPETLMARWSSDLQGELGESEVESDGATSLTVEELLPGTHTVTLSVMDSADQTGSDSVTFLINTAPGAPVITLSPVEPTTLDDLIVVVDTPSEDPDRDASALSYSFSWLRDGDPVSGLEGDTVSADETTRGELWVVVVTPWDGLNEGDPATAEVTIVNSAPTCPAAEMDPLQGETATVFTCTCPDREDADGDAAIDTCVFTSADGEIDEAVDAVDGACQLDPALTTKGMTLTCTYTPGDGEDEGESATSEDANVVNTAPGPATIAIDPTEGNVKTAFSCNILNSSDDLDGDSLDYLYQWYVGGYPSDGATGSLVVADLLVSDAEGTPARGGDTIRCEVVADDGDAQSITAVSQDVLLANSPPSGGQAVVTPFDADESTTLTCEISGGGDADGDDVTWEIDWLVDDVTVDGEDDGTLTGEDFDKGQQVKCLGTPSDGTESGEVVESSNMVTIANSPPPEPSAELSPAEGGVGTTFTCDVTGGGADADGDQVIQTVAWVVNGFVNPDITDATIVASMLESDELNTPAGGGDFLSCQASAYDGEDYSAPMPSNTVLLGNTAPSGGSVSVTPAAVTTVQDVTCEATDALDPDGDIITWSYVWFVNGDEVAGETEMVLAASNYTKGQEIHCLAVPWDGTEVGPAVTSSNTVTVANSPPAAPVIVVSPSSGSVSQTYTCSLDAPALDVDGDEVTHTVTWLVNGYENPGELDVSVEASGLLASESGTLAAGGDLLQCRVVASDGTTETEPCFGPEIVFGNAAPEGGEVTITPTEAWESDVLVCTASGATDPDGQAVYWDYAWWRNDVAIDGVTTSTLDGNHFDKGDELRCSATPTDGQAVGVPVQSDVSVQILNSVPTAPLVALTPQSGGVLTTFTCEVQVEGADDDPGDTLEHVVTWLVGDYENLNAHEASRTAVGLVSDASDTPARGGDLISCRVRADDGDTQSAPGESQAVVLDNTAPQGGQVTVDPPEAIAGASLTCVATGAVDPDGQPVTWTYVWLVNGEQVADETSDTLVGENFAAGDAITCTATPTDGSATGDAVAADNTVSVANSLPTTPTIALSPADGQAITEFTCDIVNEATDPDGDFITYEKRWLVNDHVNDAWQEPAKPLNLWSDAAETPARGGDTFGCQARAYDGFGHSDWVLSSTTILANTAPSGGVVWVTPPEAAEGATLSCEASGASDADGDGITWSYAWYADDVLIADQTDETLTSDHFESGDIVRCEAMATDGEDDGPELLSENAVQVGNSVPTAPEVALTPEAGTVNDLFTCEVTVESTDSDPGDTVSYVTHWVVSGYENVQLDAVTAAPSQLMSDALGTAARGGDTFSCRVRATDGVGLSEAADSVVITLDNSAPTGGSVTISPESLGEVGTVHCQAGDAVDGDGDLITWSYVWHVDDAPVEGQVSDSLTGEHFDKHQTVTCAATPSDDEASGDQVWSANSALIVNTPPVLAGATITPLETNRPGTFSCTGHVWQDVDPADTDEGVSFQWLLETDQGLEPIAGAVQADFSPQDLSPGDKVACRATPFDADQSGAPVQSELGTVINTPPSIELVALSGTPFSDQVLNCAPVNGTDADGDALTYVTAWLVNGDEVPDATGSSLSGVFDKGDTVRCVMTPNDGYIDGLAKPSNEVTILNTLPSLASASVSPQNARLCESFTCSPGQVNDPDQSDQATMQYVYRWTVNGDPAGVTTETLAWPNAEPGDKVVCIVSPWDGTYDGNLQPLTGDEVSSAPGTFVNPAPALASATVKPEVANVDRGEVLTCEHAGYTDDCNVPGTFEYFWHTKDPATGTLTDIGEEGATFDTAAVDIGLEVLCTARASDGHASFDVQSTNSVGVQNAPPVAGSVNIQAPDGADGDVICDIVEGPTDHEPLTLTYLWRIGEGNEFEGPLFLANAAVDHCDRVRCRLQVSDGDLTATTATAEVILPFGSGADCNDNNVCTSAQCGAQGGCVQSHADGFCDDATACTYDDTCVDTVCVGTAYDCADTDPCTDDECNGDSSCSYPFNTAPCNDGSACTIGDTCSSGLCEGTTVDCSIYDTGCFVSQCAGACAQGDDCACIDASCAACELVPAAGQSCDDGDLCTLNDVCSATGVCEGVWDKNTCGCDEDATCEADPEYNDACHVGRCDLSIFACYKEEQPDGFACDDSDPCTHTDECVAGVCTVTPYSCDDSKVCTDDSCDGDGTCTNTSNTLPCDDENACTEDDTCHNTVCVGGEPPACDDDVFCNGQETCDEALGCLDGTEPALDDGVGCTVDSCDEEANAVVHLPDDTLCDTATICVEDTCDPVNDCQSTALSDCCGNGVLEGDEACDDGNLTKDDGCSPECECECPVVETKLCTDPSGQPVVEEAVTEPMAILGPGGQTPTSSVTGDVDGDGDGDILVGYESQSTMMFLNDGTGTFASFTLPRPAGNTSPARALVLGDLDNDGDVDLLIGYDGADDRMVLNDGSSTPFTSDEGSVLDTGALSTTSMALGDLEPDGDLDLVVGHTNEGNHFLANLIPSSPFVGSLPIAFDTGLLDTRDVALTDVDYDGDLDIVAANIGATNTVHTNFGAPLFFLEVAGLVYDLGADVEDSHDILVWDLNRDGYDDIAIANGPGGYDRVFSHPGNTFGFAGIPGFEMGASGDDTRDMVLVDYDENGAPDIMRGHPSSNDVVFNTGQELPFFQSPPQQLEPPEVATDTRGLLSDDFNKDGARDVAYVSALLPTTVHSGSATTPLVGVIDRALNADLITTTAIAVGHIARVPYPDVVLAQDDGTIHVIANNQTVSPYLSRPALVEAGDDELPVALALADINRNGWLDLVVVNDGKVNRVYFHAEITTSSPTELFYPTDKRVDMGTAADGSTDVVVGDFDNDSDLDIAVSNELAPNKIYLNAGDADPFAGAPIEITTDTDASFGIAAGDLDGDGRLDVVIANRGGSSRVVLSRGDTPFALPLSTTLNDSAGDSTSAAVGDIDRDGDMDVVLGQDGAVNQLYLNDGTNNPFGGVNPSAIGADTDDTRDVALIDVDLDGDLDLVTGNVGAPNRLYLNDGTATPFSGAVALDITDAAHGTVDIAVGRVDHDAYPDLASANDDAASQLYLSWWLLDEAPSGQCVAECPAVVLDCDDKLFCNGEETCTFGHICVDGDVPTDPDGMDCTIDICDEELDDFVYEADDSLCSTSALCMTSVCSVNLFGCVEEAIPECCGDGTIDAGEACDDSNIDSGDGCDAGCNCECDITGPFACLGDVGTSPFDDATVEQVSDTDAVVTAAAVADMDGDGDLDTVVATDGANLLYLNAGTAPYYTDAVPVAIGAETDDTRTVLLADFDGDGDMDLVAGNFGAPTRYYANSGTEDPFVNVTALDIETEQTRALAAADLNGDGHLDLVIGNQDGRDRYHLNNGDSAPFNDTTGKDIGQATYYTAAIALGDMDSDGDVDVVAGHAGQNMLYLNAGGDDGLTGAVGLPFVDAFEDTVLLALTDADQDGDLDVLVGNDGTAIYYYANAATSPPFEDVDAVAVSPPDLALTGLAVADFDVDGAVDLAVATYEERPTIYYGDGSAEPFPGTRTEEVGILAPQSSALVAADVAANGTMDLVLVSADKPATVFLNGRSDSYSGSVDVEVPNTIGDARAIASGDMDNDGDVDLVLAFRNSPNRVIPNNHTIAPFADAEPYNVTSDGNDTRAVVVGDVNGDGWLDVVAGNLNQTNRLYLHDGSETPFATTTGTDITADADGTRGLVLGDLDHDGDLDLFVCNEGAPDRVVLNNGTLTPFANVTSTPLGDNTIDSWAAAIGDLDGDGHPDIAVANNSGPNVYYKGLGNGTFTSHPLGLDNEDSSSIAIADMNGNGNLEVVVGNQLAVNRFYANDGSTVPFGEISGTSITSDASNTLAITVGDFDLDGDVDVFAANSDKPLRVYFNDGTILAFDDNAEGHNIQDIDIGAYGAVAAHLDRDGRLDVAVANKDGKSHWLPNHLILGTEVPVGCAGSCAPISVTCDDANTCSTDICTLDGGCDYSDMAPDCCGNGTQETGETCDDGNQVDGDGCNSDCSGA